MKIKTNYLDKIPVRSKKIDYNADENGNVTLRIKNEGIVNKFAQIVFHKPATSCIHLDETGSFIWLMIDGRRNICDIAALLDSKFGVASHPLYERIVDFFMILEKNGFIIWIK